MSELSSFVTFTVNPSAVDTGVENVGTGAAGKVVPVTVATPDSYPDLVVATLTVEDTPAATPVTINPRVAPLAVPSQTTVPVLPAAIVGVNV